MLCGIPTCGKSTYVENGLKTIGRSYVILSTDSYIERKALQDNMTYNDVFDTYIYEATKALNESLRVAISFDKHIVWDQTNLTPRARKNKLKKVPDYYLKTAVWFDISLEEAMIRNQQRPGKVIPGEVLKNMHRSFIPPTESEGFDLIYKAK